MEIFQGPTPPMPPQEIAGPTKTAGDERGIGWELSLDSHDKKKQLVTLTYAMKRYYKYRPTKWHNQYYNCIYLLICLQTKNINHLNVYNVNVYFKRPMNPIKLGIFSWPRLIIRKDHRNSAATLRFYLFLAGPTFVAVTWWCVAWLSPGKICQNTWGTTGGCFVGGSGSGWNQWLDETSIVLIVHLPYTSQMLNVWYIYLHLA